MANLKDFKDKDLYKLLEINENATTAEIRKAYRKKALKHHPDKNPDDPEAAAVFYELSECLKVLVDIGARAEYDHVRKARKAASERVAKLDEKRKKVKLDLEAREVEAERREKESSRNASKTLEREVDRLREDGLRILEEEKLYMKRILKESVGANTNSTYPAQLKVKWKITPNVNPPYTEESLMNIFSKHGDVVSIVVSCKKKRGSAIVEFRDSNKAKLAHDFEIGLPENPLSLSFMLGDPRSDSSLETHIRKPAMYTTKQTTTLDFDGKRHSALDDDDDFEKQVLKKMKMKQQEKAKQ